jgi:hypothetical protein
MDQAMPRQPTHQHPRYRRDTERTLPVVVQPRDLVLLKAIYDFPYSTAQQLSRLIPAGDTNPQLTAYLARQGQERVIQETKERLPAKVRRAMLRRLMQLFHAAGGPYVQRHKINNNSPILYTIAARAVDLLAAEYDLDTAALARSARNRDPGEKFLLHTLLRTGVRFALTVAVATQPEVEIIYWFKDGSIKIPITYQTDDGRLVEDTVIPDDVLGIRWVKSGIVEPLLLEADKRKDYPRVRKKMIAYERLLWQVKNGSASLPLAPPYMLRELHATRQVRSHKPVYLLAGQPVQNFRVLWLARGQERKEGLRRLARDLAGPQGEAAGLFWFTHESQYLHQPERVLGPIWQKARNDTWRPLMHD